MTLNEIVAEIKLEITGGILELEISDENIEKIVNRSLHEIQRYIDSTKLITVPFARCIDLKDSNISSVSRVYRATNVTNLSASDTFSDPAYAQMWAVLGGSYATYNLTNWVNNYAAYSTVKQIMNTSGADMSFIQDKSEDKLYINCKDTPDFVTIEYVPKIYDVSDITSDYWLEILLRMAVAQTKVILGRIRSRYSLSNALWQNDGDTLLQEGNAELASIRDRLQTNSQLIFPLD